MDAKQIGRLIFLQHGETDYTDSEFDLTPEGVKSIQAAAMYLLSILKGYIVRLFYSPKPRAKASAFVLNDELGPLIVESGINRHIGSIRLQDPEKAMALFKEFSSNPDGLKPVKFAYLTDERFNDPKICETWAQTKGRFYWYLGYLIRELFWKNNNKETDGKPQCIISITHYELLCHFLIDLFGIGKSLGDALKYGEIIDVQVFATGKKNTARLEVHFRSQKCDLLYEVFEEAQTRPNPLGKERVA